MMNWPPLYNYNLSEPEETTEVTIPSSEWIHLVVHSNGTPGGTRVTWHGVDITDQVILDIYEPIVFSSERITEPVPPPDDMPCVECHGYGWGKTESGKDVPCRACYGRGR